MRRRPRPAAPPPPLLLLAAASLAAAAACAPARPTATPSATPSATPPAPPPPRPVPVTLPSERRAERLADSLVALMTLEEKIGQLTMAPAEWNQTGPAAPAGGDQQVREGRIGSFLSFWGADATRRMQRIAVEQSRLHVPLLFAQDVIHGWRTVFPVPLAQAASFDSAAVERAERIAAVEASAFGIHWTFAPMVDIARDPRWGRVVEGAGEDPHLGSVMAAARVRGFQGARPSDLAASTTILATPKHFAFYGGAEGGRDYNSVELSERTMWDVYLPPFEAAVRAGAGSIMPSFNDTGGTPSHASSWLLGDVLRGRWGFAGVVVSDWAGVEELIPHGVAATRPEAAARGLDAGVDVDMADGIYRTDLPAAVRAGLVDTATIDAAVRRVLRAKYALGLFDDPYRYGDTTLQRRYERPTPEHRSAARELARESVVLLKNAPPAAGAAPALPLGGGLRSIAVVGPLADDRRSPLGSWSGSGRDSDVVSTLAGIREAAGSRTRVTYVRGAPVDTPSTAGFAEAVRAARAADAVIMVLGERDTMSGEASNRASIELPGAQLALAQAVTRAARADDPRKPVVVVLMNGRPLAVQWLADSVPAVVESWFLGVEHGHAVADVLFGEYSPSGRLPMTFPRVTGQIPIYYNHRNTGRPAVPTDHYTSKYLDAPETPLYPFGHGLSYTTFAYANLRLSAAELPARDTLAVSVDVTNAGRRAGDDVVQLYVRDDAASVARPVRQLVGFARLALQPGETRTVRFALPPDALAFHDLAMRKVVEPGTFTLFAGASSAATLEAHFRVTGDTLVLEPATPRFR